MILLTHIATTIVANLISAIFEIALQSIKRSPRYAIFSLIQNLLLIPLTLIAAFIIALLDVFPTYFDINIEGISVTIISFMFVVSIGVVFLHMLSFNPNYRGFVKLIGLPVVEDSELGISLIEYQSYLVNIAHFFIIFAASVGALLWFIFPTKGRLEPLTAILTVLATLIAYLRGRYSIKNPLDTVFTSQSSTVQPGD
jgi:hypothetical protein